MSCGSTAVGQIDVKRSEGIPQTSPAGPFAGIVFTLVLLVTILRPLLTRDILLLNHELCYGSFDVSQTKGFPGPL